MLLEYENKLRPDYYRPLETSGILLEVERGKTTTNNMDLLDFWKCHLCRHADYLFLMVPQALPAQSRHDSEEGVQLRGQKGRTRFSCPGTKPTCARCTSSATNSRRARSFALLRGPSIPHLDDLVVQPSVVGL